MWDTDVVVVSVGRRAQTSSRQRTSLAHVLVVGGTPGEWADLGEHRWERRVADLGEVAAAAGARWLTLRAYGPGGEDAATDELVRWDRAIDLPSDADAGGHETVCTVIVDPCADGRSCFADAIRRVQAAAGDQAVTTRAVAEALYAPATSEPDLVLVLGPADRLPPSLVWELAYGELVFADARWDELAADHLAAAFGAFASRQRRFGGLS